MQKWEYFILPLPLSGQNVKATTDLLKDYGDGGWELVAVSAVQSDFEKYFFKRPVR